MMNRYDETLDIKNGAAARSARKWQILVYEPNRVLGVLIEIRVVKGP